MFIFERIICLQTSVMEQLSTPFKWQFVAKPKIQLLHVECMPKPGHFKTNIFYVEHFANETLHQKILKNNPQNV